jgi:hypothetical protein
MAGMLLEDKATMAEPIQQQIQRIVQSEQFRSSEVLRRLLTFLSEKAIAGEADNLKEYVVAIDGLGKSSTYYPQHNSAGFRWAACVRDWPSTTGQKARLIR